jgi:hypothetical protein
MLPHKEGGGFDNPPGIVLVAHKHTAHPDNQPQVDVADRDQEFIDTKKMILLK